MINQQYTLILPIKIDAHKHNELHRFIQIQLRSLNKFLDIPSVHEFILICKEYEMKIIQQTLLEHPSPLPIRLISENLLIKKEFIATMPGWYLQQLIKLAIAKIIKTSLYLILDTDCFLTKPFAYENLFYQGKILMDRELWTNHPGWWLESIKIIDETPLTKVASELTIAVTPQILVTDIVLELLDYLSHKEKNVAWDEYLATRLFTEFSLYWLFLLKTNRTNIYQQAGVGPSLLGNALWSSPWKWLKQPAFIRFLKNISSKHRKKMRLKIAQSKQMVIQQVKTSFESNDHFYFSLIQSNIKEIPVEWVIEETNKYLT